MSAIAQLAFMVSTLLPPAHPALDASSRFYPSLSAYRDTLPLGFSRDDALHSSISAAIWISVVAYVLGEVTGNVSQIDRVWTFLPVVFSAIFTFSPLWSPRSLPNATFIDGLDDRMLLVFTCQLLWSARLTTNTIRRGFFSWTAEDYRWPIVRDSLPKWQWKVLCLVFVAFTQVFLLWSTALVQYFLLTIRSYPEFLHTPVGALDYTIAGIFCFVLVVEQISDNQQQRYQKWKRSRSAKQSSVPEDQAAIERGFITSGLWSWSRHPNFACEQATWWILYLFTLVPTLHWSLVSNLTQNLIQRQDWNTLRELVKDVSYRCVNFSLAGPVLMSLLFLASTRLTEQITLSKYPAYKDYQVAVDMFMPPLTALRYVVLTVIGKRSEVYDKVFGSSVTSANGTKSKRE